MDAGQDDDGGGTFRPEGLSCICFEPRFPVLLFGLGEDGEPFCCLLGVAGEFLFFSFVVEVLEELDNLCIFENLIQLFFRIANLVRVCVAKLNGFFQIVLDRFELFFNFLV